METIFAQVSQQITTWDGAWEMAGLILCFFVVWLIGFYLQSGRLFRDIKRAVLRLRRVEKDQFVGSFEAFDQDIARNRSLAHLWSEFRETLIFPRNTEDQQKIRNTQPPSFFFTQDHILHRDLNMRLYDAVPNYLTGLGILGTFIGLVCGIYLASGGLVSDEVGKVTQALRDLLGGAALAFITSIAGLLFSIIFSWLRNHRIQALNRWLGEWNRLLDERLEFASLERLTDEILGEETKQSRELQTFNTDLAFQIAQALDEKIGERLTPALETLIKITGGLREDRAELGQGILSGVVDSFRDTLNAGAGAELASIQTTLAELNQSLRETIGGLASSQQNLMNTVSQMAAHVRQSMEDGSTSVHQRLMDAVNQFTQILTNSGNTLTNRLETTVMSMNESLQSTMRDLANSQQALVDTMSQMGNSVRQSMEEGSTSVQEGLQNAVNLLTENLTQGGNTLAEQLNTTSNQVCENLANVMGQFSQSVDRLVQANQRNEEVILMADEIMERFGQFSQSLEQARGAFTGITQPLQQACDSVLEAMVSLEESVNQATQTHNSLADAANRMQQSNQQLREIWSDYDERFTEVDQSLTSIFSEITSGIENYTGQIQAFHTEMDQQISKAISAMGGAINDLGESVEELSTVLQSHRR